MRVTDSERTVDYVDESNTVVSEPFPEYLLSIGEGRLKYGLNSACGKDYVKRVALLKSFVHNVKTLEEACLVKCFQGGRKCIPTAI